MRLTRILLVLLFLAVGAVFTIQDMANRFSAADEPPVLTCDTEILNISVKDDDSVLLTGITAADPQDGDITDRVLVTGVSRLMDGNIARISYAVFDSDHNMATLTRQIRYTDYRLPRFSLEQPLVYAAGDEIRLLDRLHATDVVDGDITGSIRVTFTDTTTDPGIHNIQVQVTNSMGDTAWQTLPVLIMKSTEDTVEVDLDTYLVYLKQGDNFQPRRYLNGASYNGDPVSTANVTISGDVDTGTPGTYNVTYTGTYGSHTGSVILTVVVE